MMDKEIPIDATHKRDGTYYKVTDKAQYFDNGKWHNCVGCYELSEWLGELVRLNT